MLDKLPASARHLTIILLVSFVGTLVQAVLAARGVTGVDWPDTLLAGVDDAAVAGATGVGVLWLTPLTRQYGVGALTTRNEDGQ